MTSDGIQIIEFLFTQIWRFFTDWTIPGTGTTPAAFFVFLLMAVIGIRLVVRVFSTDVSDVSSGGDKS